MSYLYGHIAHYSLDKEIHPIVGALSNNTLSKSIIKPHTYIECLFDKYLLKGNKIDDYSFINCKSVNNKVLSKLINNTYRTSYGMLDIRRIYELTILIIKRANKVLNRLYNNDNLFKKITRIDKYNKNSTFYKFVNSKKITKKILFRNILHSSINEALKMIDAVNKGTLNLEKLEAMTAICSVGLDMIVIPGDAKAATISAIIADEAAIGVINNKTTAVRIIPAPGYSEGDMVEFGGLLGSGPVMRINEASSEEFIKRGGRIPAPIHSFKN